MVCLLPSSLVDLILHFALLHFNAWMKISDNASKWQVILTIKSHCNPFRIFFRQFPENWFHQTVHSCASITSVTRVCATWDSVCAAQGNPWVCHPFSWSFTKTQHIAQWLSYSNKKLLLFHLILLIKTLISHEFKLRQFQLLINFIKCILQ